MFTNLISGAPADLDSSTRAGVHAVHIRDPRSAGGVSSVSTGERAPAARLEARREVRRAQERRRAVLGPACF